MLTPEEQKQVQSIITARTKLLNERISIQEEQIANLSSQLDDKDKELDTLKTRLAESQEQNSALMSELEALRSRPEPEPAPEPEPQPAQPIPQPQKPTYLVSLLRQHFGLDAFRPGQEEIIDAILSGRDIFCSMPAHYGMSICFRLPALLMPGLTLVITPSEPVIVPKDSHSEILSSSLSAAKKRSLLRNIRNSSCKILYSALEELQADDIKSALSGTEISFAAVLGNIKDSGAFLDAISKKRISRGIFAQSTSPLERQDMFRALRSPLRVITGFNRPDVSFTVLRKEDKLSAVNEILAHRKGQPGVIFCSTPETVYKLSEALGTISDKITILPSVLYGEIERKDIRFVIHYDPPENLAAYSQEINSAGLDGQKAECIMLISRKDIRGADKSIVRFCEDTEPKESLLSYLGEDEKLSQPQQSEQERFLPEDFSDFDFGSANEAQKEAITTTSGPLLIIAGPGTGKTYTLVQRAVFLIQKKHVKPGAIMLATFTDKAAQELITRIAEELSSRKILADTGAMYTGTFHVICERILKEYSDFTDRGKNFRILDDFGHAYMILQNYRLYESIEDIDEVFRNSGKWKRACELRDYISTVSEELIDPEELVRSDNQAVRALGKAMLVHSKMLADNNAFSYSALLAETYRLLRDNPEILASLQHKIQYIMIDEYQDTNYVQEQLIFLLGTESRNICVVGDDDQSLYRFRGATVRNILEFADRWGKNECKTVKLMLNYRSTPAIVKFASEWIEDTGDKFSWGNFRHPKRPEAFKPDTQYPSVMRLAGVHDKEGWHEKLAAFIKSLKDSGVLADYSQIAFLFRSVKAKTVQELSHYLENNNISVYSPRSNLFFKRTEIYFALGCLISMFPDYLRALEAGAFSFQGKEPDYIAYYRDCLATVARYIDKPQYADLKKWLLKKRNHHAELKGYTGYTYSDLLYELFAFTPFPHALDAKIGGNVKELRPARNLSKLISIFRDYEHSYNINNLHAKNIASQFQMLMNIFIRFRIDEGLDEYESDYEAVPPGHVAFMTIHQAKGREFPVVFVDSLWSVPDSELRMDRNNSLMAEIAHNYSRRPAFEPDSSIKYFDFWRMFYVAFTRAQNLLILTCNEDNKTPSSFLEEAYNKLEDADEVFSPSSDVELAKPKDSGLRSTYSFTSNILLYESCPMQYKFFRELEFMPALSQSTFMGTLVHATIEDIHRAVLNQEEKKITGSNIAEWFNSNYERLSRMERAYLNEASRRNALGQVMHYVHRQGSDWSGILMAESDVSLVRNRYILEGKIDLIRVRDDETEIIDFKTGPKPNININRDRERLENNRRQVNVYAYLAVKSLGLTVNSMKLYYTGEESSTPEIVYPYDENEAEGIMQNIDGTVDRIIAQDFEHRTQDLETCKDCVFRFYCERT
ncbi:MAG: UvrD-helicase domain-containing protein [Synergistaceae bacterium]|nr:UvrD-helicase domain-containing protein [Synergistaceae bacterium]